MPVAKKKSAKLSKEKATVLTFLLDETGSMASVKEETISGFNSYMAEQKKQPGNMEVNFIKFDSVNPYNIVCSGKSIKDVPELTLETYIPRAYTPLIDSSYRAIITTENELKKRKDKPNVLVVIQTDGRENASQEHTTKDLKILIEQKQSEGWVFVFLGADLNAYDIAGSFGISAETTSSYNKTMTGQTFDTLSLKTSNFRASGSVRSMDYSDADRRKQGDKWVK